MSGTYKNIIGEKFGKLTVISTTDQRTKRGHMVWQCLCDCGNTSYIDTDRLKSGNTKSCGCLHIKSITKHLKCNTRLYRIWAGMKYRCSNPNAKKYSLYGGKGIIVCKEWESDFESFYQWALSNGYSENLSIDRIDGNGNYCPDNCRWADSFTQNNNRKFCNGGKD